MTTKRYILKPLPQSNINGRKIFKNWMIKIKKCSTSLKDSKNSATDTY